jgi:hypothetical protein
MKNSSQTHLKSPSPRRGEGKGEGALDAQERDIDGKRF